MLSLLHLSLQVSLIGTKALNPNGQSMVNEYQSWYQLDRIINPLNTVYCNKNGSLVQSAVWYSRQFGTVVSAVGREAAVPQLRGFNSRSR